MKFPWATHQTLKKLVCLGRPVRLRLASLRFAKESSASRAKEPLHAGKNRCALKSGEPADRFEEQSSVMSPRSLTRPTIRSIEKARCRDVRYAHEKARVKPVTAEVRHSAAFGGTQCRPHQIAMHGKASLPTFEEVYRFFI